MMNRVAEYRNNIPISQEDFAEILGISRGHLSNIENGKVPNLSGSLMLRISREFGVPVERIFFDDDGRNSEHEILDKTG